MITDLHIKNFKSIGELQIKLSRVNVLIGENGAGKSNFLEAIALISAASENKLDNEFLTTRGIRVTQPAFMRQAFDDVNSSKPIETSITNNIGDSEKFKITNDNQPYAKWSVTEEHKVNVNDLVSVLKILSDGATKNDEEAKEDFFKFIKSLESSINRKLKKSMSNKGEEPFPLSFKIENELLGRALISSVKQRSQLKKELEKFLIFSPENSSLKTFEREGQVEPLGINGEGLLKLISVISEVKGNPVLNEIKARLKVLGWFEDFHLSDDSNLPSKTMKVKDRYVQNETSYFDQLSTNEGFLFLLFYFTLFASDLTPKFFAIDNIDASLNPKLCEKLMKILVEMAKKYDKQVIFTTHNPSILDGLNLDDDEQTLYVVSRSRNGSTKLKQVFKPVNTDLKSPVRLSEMFIKGMLGGLPKGF
ncbi:MAG: ATPase/GTPase, AAA15 family [Candidatus Nitrotoga sp. CP45]|nr:MAG: ATPase/GTPase, AAA15 family [Candidatus Nitrotoga sp. CP45]